MNIQVEEVLSEESNDEEDDKEEEEDEDLDSDNEIPLVDEEDEALRNSGLKERHKRTVSEETYGEEEESFRPPPTKVSIIGRATQRRGQNKALDVK